MPLDDYLYALQSTIPHLMRSSLHRCLQCNGIAWLPDLDGDKPKKPRFKRYPILHLNGRGETFEFRDQTIHLTHRHTY